MEYNPIPFDQTYILYDPNDIISIACVHLSLLPVYVMVFYTSWFLITREIEPVIVVGGHLIGEIANKIIKRILKGARPQFHKDFGSGSFSMGYGMPSAHSQFMGFFAAYFSCIVLYRVAHLSNFQKRFGCFILILSSILVAFSRVYLLYHTLPQVVVGNVLGLILGTAYFVIACVVRDAGVIDWILGWGFIKMFYVKDSYYHAYQTFKDEYEEAHKRSLIRAQETKGARVAKIE